MKKSAAFSLLMSFITLLVHAQNVGIGNTDPAYNLDLSGRMRIRGGANIFLSAGIWLGGSGADSAVNKVFIGMQADSVAGFYSSKSDVGWGFLFDGRNGNIGLKNATPNFPISFQDVAGDKISLFPDVNGNHYGLGIGNSTMQLMTSNSTSDFVFGYGRSAAFTENMRIKGNGNVGIGVSDPVYTLDISNRMRIRGKPGFSAGIWLNNEANTALSSFVGMQADNQVGFFGFGSAGWGLLMNTQTGAVSFGGNAGQPGQVLISQGANGSASWANPGMIIKTGYSGASTDIQLPATGSVDLTSSQYSITLTRAARIILQYKTRTFKPCSLGSCNTKWVFSIFLNGNITQTFYVDGTSYHVLPGSTVGVSSGTFGPDYFDVGPGTHTFTFRAYNSFNQPKIEFFQALSTIVEH